MKGVFIIMGKSKHGMMSEGLKIEIAKELGFYDKVQRAGWGGISSKDAGNMVKRALELAEQRLNK
jgi:small acid-soluble spore protein F (minor alpha/beta-type SASP)